jgi:hypothetical protein
MKKNLLITAVIFSLSVFSSFSQTYEQWGLNANGDDWDTLYNYGENSTFEFTGIPAGIWGNAQLIIYQDGDFGDSGEFSEVYDNGTSTFIGMTSNHPDGDCTLDSFVVNLSSVDILSWENSGTWTIDVFPSGDVDFFCGTFGDMARLKTRLILNYCSFGAPVEFASITNTESVLCPSDNAFNLTGSPAGGTFSGIGVSGNMFNPSGLAAGNYTVSYMATDGIGCVTSDSKEFKINTAPGDRAFLICEGTNAPAIEPINKEFVFAYDLAFSNTIDTVAGYTHGPIVNSPEVIYFANITYNDKFTLDDVTVNNSAVVDHDSETGDDRGGIAINDNYVFVVGDNNTARFDLDLTNPLVLQIRDGIFTDLKERKIWSLYNDATSIFPEDDNTNFMVDAIVALDDDLNATAEMVMLSMAVPMGNGNSQNNGIFAGYGKLGLYNGDTEDFYVIDITTGEVELINNLFLDLYWSENWSDWGTLSFDGTDFFANYRSSGTDQIVAHNISADISNNVSNFSDVSDLSSFVFHPTNNRVYFHYEGSGEFGGSSETLGYIDAVATIVENPSGTLGCPSMIEYTFNSIDLGNDVTICGDQTPLILEAGFGYSSYTWNGVNNNWNIFPVSTSGTYTVEAIDAANCLVSDQIIVTVDQGCVAGVDELTSESFNVYPVPNNGKFVIDLPNEMNIHSVVLVDMNGKICYDLAVNGTTNKINVEAVNLEAGIYIINVVTTTETVRKQIVVTK